MRLLPVRSVVALSARSEGARARAGYLLGQIAPYQITRQILISSYSSDQCETCELSPVGGYFRRAIVWARVPVASLETE